MVSKEMMALGKKRSVIREIFEYSKVRSAEIGADKVFDFSIGNPNVPAPDCVNEALIEMLQNEDSVALHGYTSAQGDFGVRKTIADDLNVKHGTSFSADNLYMTVGAAASLTICIKALTLPDDEFIIFAPFFPEYRVFIESAGAKVKVIPVNEDDFQINFDVFEKTLSANTKAVIVNSPNNPSGVVYSEKTIIKLAEILNKKSLEYGHPIYIIADEPYRELVYNDVKVPFLTKYYNNTLVCYSYSKALSLPGERIGYILVSNEMEDTSNMYAAICGAGRALGFVCAPSLFQRVVAKCIGKTADISIYSENRDLLYKSLTEFGYNCVKPDGAFYLFVKAMESDAYAFCERAKKYELLLVPSDDFGCPGYVRIAYCVKTQQIVDALPAFEKLAKEYK